MRIMITLNLINLFNYFSPKLFILPTQIAWMMRSLTIKQAEKWLQRLKQTDPAAYKDLGKCLRKYDQTSDEYECFVKINEALYPHPVFAQQINGYMEDGNKFIVNKGLQERLNSFLDIARNIKYELFKQIVVYVNKIANEDRQIFDLPNKQATEIFKTGLLNIVKNNPVLTSQAEKIIPESQEDAIKHLDLRHLKNKVINYEREQVENNKQIQAKKVKKPPVYLPEAQNDKVKESSRLKLNNAPNFLTTSQEKSFIKQHEKRIGTAAYNQLIKILQLYHHNIITRFEFCNLVSPIVGVELAGFKDILQARQVDRRKSSTFKPLSDIDFHILPRQTHSYVEMPSNYPHYAANRTKKQLQIFNNKWVSVPRGSEVTFNVRIKNLYQIALNKCQDQRYEFDLILIKLKKIAQIFHSIVKELQIDQTKNVVHQLNKAISLGVLQFLYRNSSKEQKQIFEDALINNTLAVVKVWLVRVQKIVEELEQYKKLYAIKSWNEVAHKNFYKSLDFKNHEFKNSQKIKMRSQTFIDELNYNVKFLQSRGAIKINDNPFEGKRQFFSILNSFQSSSRKQRCLHRQLPTPVNYSLTDHKFPSLLPAMILAFEDQQTLLTACSLMYFYIESVLVNEGEKLRCKLSLKEIMSKIFKQKALRMLSLNSNFEQDKFFSKIINNTVLENIDGWVDSRTQSLIKPETAHEEVKIPFFNSMQDSPSEYNFEPPKTEKNVVFYASEHFYTFLRFLYSLYERIIRMRQVTSDPRKIKLFQILYFACIRAKQSNRFEDSLTLLFSEYAYLFTTFYKIVEGGIKSLSSIALSPLQNYSMSLLSMKNEQVYLLLLNRYMLNMQANTTRLIRVTHELDSNLVYIHSFNPYYRFNDESLKQYNKKRLQISRNVEVFNQQAQKQSISVNRSEVKWANYQQYYFQSYSNKLINLPSFEDVVLGPRSPQINIQGEVQKLKKLKGFYK